MKIRLDKLLVDLDFAQSRERARALILAGNVIVDDHRIDKAGAQVDVESQIRIKGQDIPYVSRGGLKLAKALTAFDICANGVVAIDVGASTGGFTDCLLQAGAVCVYAVDVGYGQLAWKLRENPAVINMERCNIKDLKIDHLNEIPALAVIDASFISLSKVLPSTLALLTVGGEVVALIKPQFEVGRKQVGKGGIVKDRQLQDQIVDDICHLAISLNCEVQGVVESPILGAKGNREFLIHLKKKCL
jgi:23S rRNA (cytidine1920-2'-O)/16S rRNA (cytidine1409-2'-O)-methyltransferase